MAQTTAQTPATANANPQATNNAIRNLIVHGGTVGGIYYPPSLDMWQQLNPVVPSGFGLGSTLTQQLRNVGLVKRLLVEISLTITTPAVSGNALTLTSLGLSNLLSQIIFTDLANNQRINTTGWHLIVVSSAKRRRVFGAAYTSDTPYGYGSNYTTVVQAPTTIAANGGSATVNAMFEIPFAYSDQDLRGAIFADVTQATMQVAMTLNPNMFATSSGDPALAVYQSASSSVPTAVTNVSCQIYQNYLDQLPTDKSGVPILPSGDLATAYMLTNTSSGALVQNQNNATPFINSRQFQSLAFVYDESGSLTQGNISYVTIQSANLTNITQFDGNTLALMGRNIVQDDFPLGMYYLDFRHRPIDTNQYGNYQFVINPSAVGAGTAVAYFGWEAMGIIGLVNQGGSIPSGT